MTPTTISCPDCYGSPAGCEGCDYAGCLTICGCCGSPADVTALHDLCASCAGEAERGDERAFEREHSAGRLG